MFDFDQDGVINEYDLRRTYASLGHPDVDDDEIKQMLSEVSACINKTHKLTGYFRA